MAKKLLSYTSLGVTAAIVGGALFGGTIIQHVQFARAAEDIDATRAQLSTVQDLATVFKKVNHVVEPSVVSIEVTKVVKNTGGALPDNDLLKRFFPDRDGDGQPDVPQGFNEQEQQGQGSGVIMQVDGDTAYILTNNHVAGGATEMVVTLPDGREIRNAKLVGVDPKSDLAVVRISADRLIAAKWGDSAQLEKGDIVVAFGAPFGYVGSMTHGIVSALNRQANILGEQGYENFIQVDAPINPGNSGGPLVNLHGEVVGINTAIASRSGGFQGIGFAIPSQQAKMVYEQIRDKGKVVRGWLGVGITDVAKAKDAAEMLGFTADKGVFVQSVMTGTPAAGKLQTGDVITKIGGKTIDTMRDLRNTVALTAPNTDIDFTIFRDGKTQDVTIKIGEQPEDLLAKAGSRRNTAPGENDTATAANLGITLGNVTQETLERQGLSSDLKGALVVSIAPNSIASAYGVQVGDLITRVGKTDVTSAKTAAEALAKENLAKGLMLNVTNKEGSRLVIVKTGK